jgi:predicted amidohydrolase YtcJ
MSADLILKNARVITMDPAHPTAELVAIRDNKVLAVAGSEAWGEVREVGGKIIDCQGRTVMPGFNDAHCHTFSFIRKMGSLDLSPSAVSSIVDIKSLVQRRAQDLPQGSWLTGTDYNEFYLAEKRHPNRRDLDEAAPHHPVVLLHRSLHACVLNSRALSLAGITRETAEPPGAIIERELDSGKPSGLLFEMVGYIMNSVIPQLSEDELAGGIAQAGEHYLAMGITSLQEASVTNNFSRWQLLKKFTEGGRLKSRVSMMFGLDALSQFQQAGLSFGAGDSHLRLGGVKLMLNKATAQPQLNEQAFSAHEAGFQLAIHCVEPDEVEAAISALEYINSRSPIAGRRHRLEHCSECPPPLLERLSRLGAMVVTQPPFVYYSGERYLATIPPARLKWLYRVKSFLDGGLIVGGSSDCPVVADNPLVGIYAAVTRRAESGECLSPEEAISAEQALAMYTINAAHASFEEDIKGSIIPGKLADLVVLSDDPLKSPPEQIKDIRVEMTILDGKIAWEA